MHIILPNISYSYKVQLSTTSLQIQKPEGLGVILEEWGLRYLTRSK